jgi:hypothetical protein
MARLQQANPTPEAEAAMAYLRVATALVEEKSTTTMSVASSSSRHLCSRSNQPARSNLPTHIQEEVDQNNPDQPRVNDAKDGDLRANVDKNKCVRDVRSYIDQRHCECEEREL